VGEETTGTGETGMSLVVRGILAIAGLLAALFIARDAANFGLAQVAIGLLLVVALIALFVALRRKP
jgi:hypothetical protein